MTKPKWNKGAPPSIGWWPASVYKNERAIRWWDGSKWSGVAFPEYSAESAAAMVKFKWICTKDSPIKWTKRWWL